jgi:hypothetical protein
VLTAGGLLPLPKKQNSRAAADEVNDWEEME